MNPKNKNNLTNQQFGNLIAISEVGSDPKYKISIWKFKCILCDGIYIGNGIDVKRGKVKSCGCKKNKKEYNGNWKGIGDLYGSTYNHYRDSARLRDIEFDITIEYLWEIYNIQNRKCPYTGIELILSSNKEMYESGYIKRTPFNASLDRIDSKMGYVVGNVQWVYKPINIMKGEMSHTEFIEICEKISHNTNIDKNNYEL